MRKEKRAMSEDEEDLNAVISCNEEKTPEPSALGVGSIDSLGMIRLTLGKMNSLLFINGDLMSRDSLPPDNSQGPLQVDKCSNHSPMSRPSLLP